MVMFSQLRRCDITDEQGQQAKLLDLSIVLLDSDYPPVTTLLFLHDNRNKHWLPWEQGLSRRLLNLAERGSSGAQHTARAAVGRIAEARARGDTDMAAPLLKIDPGANAGLGLSARMAGTPGITRRALPRPRGGGRWQAPRGHRDP
jgi:hypothetical protein